MCHNRTAAEAYYLLLTAYHLQVKVTEARKTGATTGGAKSKPATDASGIVPWPDSAADTGAGGGAAAAGGASAWEPLVAMRCTHEVPTRLEVHLAWRDQGWGDRTGRVRALLRAARKRGRFAEGEVIAAEDCFGQCGETGSRFSFSRVEVGCDK